MSKDVVMGPPDGPKKIFGKDNGNWRGAQRASDSSGISGDTGAITAEFSGGYSSRPTYRESDFKSMLSDMEIRSNSFVFESGPAVKHLHTLTEKARTGGFQSENIRSTHDAPSFSSVQRKFERASKPSLGQRIRGLFTGTPPATEQPLGGVSVREVMTEHINESIRDNHRLMHNSMENYKNDNEYLSSATYEDWNDYYDGVPVEDNNLASVFGHYRAGHKLTEAKLQVDNVNLRDLSDEEVYDYAVSTGIMEGNNLHKAATAAASKKHMFSDTKERSNGLYGFGARPGPFGSTEGYLEDGVRRNQENINEIIALNERRGATISSTLRSWMGR